MRLSGAACGFCAGLWLLMAVLGLRRFGGTFWVRNQRLALVRLLRHIGAAGTSAPMNSALPSLDITVAQLFSDELCDALACRSGIGKHLFLSLNLGTVLPYLTVSVSDVRVISQNLADLSSLTLRSCVVDVKFMLNRSFSAASALTPSTGSSSNIFRMLVYTGLRTAATRRTFPATLRPLLGHACPVPGA